MRRNRWGPSPLQAATTSNANSAPTATSIESSEPSANCVKTADVLSLDSIRSTLIRQEETIIFALIERSQYRSNTIVYKAGGFGNLGTPIGSKPSDDDTNLSFLKYMLLGTEALHCAVRRYTSPEEHAFFPDRLPPQGPLQQLSKLDYPDLLEPWAKEVNFNPILLEKYTEVVVPALTRAGDDEQYGSTVLADLQVLQAMSRRVHYGQFVAESKYRADPEEYQRLVEANDAGGVMKLLTNAAVEKQVLRRARLKAATYGREPLMTTTNFVDDDSSSGVTSLVAAAAASAVVAAVEALEDKEVHKNAGKVDPKLIETIYRDFIIPLTKDIEVAYLFRRCGKEPPPEYQPDRMSVDLTSL